MTTPENDPDSATSAGENPKSRRMILSLDSLNLIIAVSAVLISAASFIATYIQSEASLKQVKAETWPYLQIDSGNFNSERREQIITYKVENAGVGPADLKQFEIHYRGQVVSDVLDLIDKCCAAEQAEISGASLTTDSPSPSIIPAGDDQLAFSMHFTPETEKLWLALDKARWELEARGCYCSLLDECFETDFKSEPKPVNRCVRDEDKEFNG